MSSNWVRPLMLRCCEIERANLRLCFDGQPADRHYVALALRGMERVSDSPAALEVLARCLAVEKRRAILKRLWGMDLGSLALLRRCGSRLWSRTIYDQFATLLASPAARSVLVRMERVTSAAITELARTPQQLVAVGGGHLAQRIGSPAATYLLDAIGTLRPDLSEREITTLLSEAMARGEQGRQSVLWRLLRERKVAYVPWSGTDAVRPLTTITEMQAAGREFHNCLNTPGRGREALAGLRVFYRVAAPHRAIVALRRDHLIDMWRVDEIKGPRNRKPSPATLAFVLEIFARAGFPHIESNHALDEFLGESWFFD